MIVVVGPGVVVVMEPVYGVVGIGVVVGVHVIPQSVISLEAICDETVSTVLASVISGIRKLYPAPEDKLAKFVRDAFPIPIVIILDPLVFKFSQNPWESETSESRLAIITIVFSTGAGRLPL
uniref:Uncharacterized protein n=1 Tax=Panagrolaimus superbus TaxID=310955 RepID=A0A914ZCP7_9BILA